MAQLSNINDILVQDINEDGNLDLVAVQNLYASEIETPRNDAGKGIVLIGNGDGSFTTLSSLESGLYASHDAKKIKSIKVGLKNLVLIANNNGPLKSFIFTK